MLFITLIYSFLSILRGVDWHDISIFWSVLSIVFGLATFIVYLLVSPSLTPYLSGYQVFLYWLMTLALIYYMVQFAKAK